MRGKGDRFIYAAPPTRSGCLRKRRAARRGAAEHGLDSDWFFILVAGEVEVIRKADGQEHRLTRLGPGGYFGEIALLHHTVRSATVRALMPVNVLSVRGHDFAALVTPLQALRTHIEQTAQQRAGTAPSPGPASGEAGPRP
jgi:CRP-like cAMP-binding protein